MKHLITIAYLVGAVIGSRFLAGSWEPWKQVMPVDSFGLGCVVVGVLVGLRIMYGIFDEIPIEPSIEMIDDSNS